MIKIQTNISILFAKAIQFLFGKPACYFMKEHIWIHWDKRHSMYMQRKCTRCGRHEGRFTNGKSLKWMKI